jgi:phosphoserine phosphatase RsbU/P
MASPSARKKRKKSVPPEYSAVYNIPPALFRVEEGMMFDISLTDAPSIDFHQTRLGKITQYIEPVSVGVGLDEAKALFRANPEFNSLPIEKDGGVIGLLDRELVLKKSESAIEMIRGRSLESYLQGVTPIMDSMESVDRALSALIDTEAEHGYRDFLIYHYGKFLGVGNFMRLIKQADFLRNRDLTEAKAVQEHLVAMGSAAGSGFEVHAFMKMAHELGGDFRQTVDLGQGGYLVACFDVSGKGVAASLTTCLISSFFTTLRISGDVGQYDSDRIVRMLGELLSASSATGRFVAGAMVFIDAKAGKIRVYNMALGPIYVFHTGEDGKALLSLIAPTSAPLGVEDFSDIEKKRKLLPLLPGMRIFIATDGLADARSPSGRMYGEEELKAFLSSRFRTKAKALLSELSKEITDHIGKAPQADDITAIAIQF